MATGAVHRKQCLDGAKGVAAVLHVLLEAGRGNDRGFARALPGFACRDRPFDPATSDIRLEAQ
jgi:hypothetical protein